MYCDGGEKQKEETGVMLSSAEVNAVKENILQRDKKLKEKKMKERKLITIKSREKK